MEHRNFQFSSLVVISALVLCAGCGEDAPKTAPAGGVVTLNGQPVAEAKVMLLGPGRPATGATDSEGRFTLSTFEPNDGAIPGSHTAIVTKEVEVATPPRPGERAGEDYREMRNVLPKKYANPQTSELTYEISVEGPNQLEVTLAE